MDVVSFFSGCGGLDLGFENAGFNVIWANEFDKTICPTYTHNHPSTILNTKSICDIKPEDIPKCDGFIGGPPCQAWSEGGKGLGLKDERGRVFLEYIRLVQIKKPKFFLIENVPGIIQHKHRSTFDQFVKDLESADYKITYKLLNAKDYGIPQDRERVFIVGIRNDINIKYEFPQKNMNIITTLKDAISDLTNSPQEFFNEKVVSNDNATITNHDVYVGPFDEKYMSRNRVREWNKPSFTIQALAKNSPIHPQAPKMIYITSDKRGFKKGYEHLYRRLSIRECARIQSFPDSFKFLYTNIKDGYKMVGNAVPPKLAEIIAQSILDAFSTYTPNNTVLIGYYKGHRHLELIKSNKLYYFPIMKSLKNAPSYLILHNREKHHLFSLKKGEISKTSSVFLRTIGFQPTKDIYNMVYIEKEIIQDNPLYLKILSNCKHVIKYYSPLLVTI